ncbi:MAG: ABC-type transport auxiliary lipoprotein family protein [Woeseiaceae bacterium]|jgi:ABC-type uncharacterized transport system auxiliary subunit|nr:ABC-type transport auxiliary lipoprotein family protein [Woeseiaceae bacterium]
MKTRSSRRDLVAALLGIGAAGALGGCVAPAPPPVRKFYLSALEAAPQGLEQVDWTLLVERPQTVPALRSNRIAQVIAGNEFDYYANAEWGDVAPDMFQATLIRSFETSNAVAAVSSGRERMRPDFILETTLGPFYAIGAAGSAPSVRVGVDARLIRARGRELVDATTIREDRAADGPEIEAIVAAFDGASHRVIEDLIAWTVSRRVGA